MATSPQELKQSDEDFKSAYNEDAPARVEPTEDEAFGITPEVAEDPAEEAGETPAQEAVEQTDDSASMVPGGQTQLEAEGDTAGSDDGAGPREGGEGGIPMEMASPGTASVEANDAVEVQPETMGADGAPKGPMSEQQLKSWEGRLRKAQSEIDAKGKTVTETPVVEALEDAGEQVEDTNPQLGDAIEVAADKVEDGAMTAEQAMKQLAEDFGEDFVKLIETIAKHHASMAGASAAESRVGEVGQAVQDIISHISDGAAKAHFKEIESAHPDFADIGQSEGFKQYIDALPEADKAEATRVATTGSAGEINKLLSTYKAAQGGEGQDSEMANEPATDPVVDQQMDAAEGVRSSGMALPEAPSRASDNYEEAWAEFK